MTTDTVAPSHRRYPQLADPEWLTDHYETQKLGPSDIARLVGCSREAVKSALKTHGIPLRGITGNALRTAALVEDVEWLARWGGVSLEDVAPRVGYTAKSLERALLRAGRRDLLARMRGEVA